MARSYKKHPWCKDGNRSKKKSKQTANRKIRRGGWSDKEIPSGGKYRRLCNQYDIFDFRSHQTFAEAVKVHQDWYDRAAGLFGQESADSRFVIGWCELYRNWARYYLWK